jgi:hypothetical protein
MCWGEIEQRFREPSVPAAPLSVTACVTELLTATAHDLRRRCGRGEIEHSSSGCVRAGDQSNFPAPPDCFYVRCTGAAVWELRRVGLCLGHRQWARRKNKTQNRAWLALPRKMLHLHVGRAGTVVG